MKSYDVIIVGGNHHNTLGVIRSLGEKGLCSYLLLLPDGNDPYVVSSRYLSGYEILKGAESVIGALLALAGDSKEKHVVISCHDGLTAVLDAHSEELSPYFFLPVGKSSGDIGFLMDKKKMAELAIKSGLCVPEIFDETPCFPCIVKPVASCLGKKSDIAVLRTREEYDSWMSARDRDKMLVQRFIDKSGEFQLIGCVLHDETVFIPGMSEILRPCKGSNTSFLHYGKLNGSLDMSAVREFIHATGYRGLFSVEFLTDRNGRCFFMEMNFRNDGNAISVTRSGVNLPYIWYLSCKGMDCSSEMAVDVAEVFVVPEFEELLLLKDKTLSFKEYLRDIRKADFGMEYDRRDPRPFFRAVRSILSRKICRVFQNDKTR